VTSKCSAILGVLFAAHHTSDFLVGVISWAGKTLIAAAFYPHVIEQGSIPIRRCIRNYLPLLASASSWKWLRWWFTLYL